MEMVSERAYGDALDAEDASSASLGSEEAEKARASTNVEDKIARPH